MTERIEKWAVLVRWVDTTERPRRDGCLAIIVQSDDPNDALLIAGAERPDLFTERHEGFLWYVEVRPAVVSTMSIEQARRIGESKREPVLPPVPSPVVPSEETPDAV